jgi:hypothetical protein
MRVIVEDDFGNVKLEWSGYAENPYDALPRAMMAVEDNEITVKE